MAKNSKKTVSTSTCGCSAGTACATAPRPAATTTSKAGTPTYEQIAQRAQEIWTKKGCLPGQDEQNWLEAERQLKAELARK
jgi:hypothetical protein